MLLKSEDIVANLVRFDRVHDECAADERSTADLVLRRVGANKSTNSTSGNQPCSSHNASASRPFPNPNNDGWHFELSPYIWFAGTHGTVGALGRDASLHATPSDLLSHVNFGIMGGRRSPLHSFPAQRRHDVDTSFGQSSFAIPRSQRDLS